MKIHRFQRSDPEMESRSAKKKKFDEEAALQTDFFQSEKVFGAIGILVDMYIYIYIYV